MKKDKTFVIIGIELFITILFIAFITVRTLSEWLLFLGLIILVELMCFVSNLIINDNLKKRK